MITGDGKCGKAKAAALPVQPKAGFDDAVALLRGSRIEIRSAPGQDRVRSSSAATAGSFFPSSTSRKAPPPVDR